MEQVLRPINTYTQQYLVIQVWNKDKVSWEDKNVIPASKSEKEAVDYMLKMYPTDLTARLVQKTEVTILQVIL